MPRPVVQATPRARKRAATQKGRLRTSGREREWSETGNERRGESPPSKRGRGHLPSRRFVARPSHRVNGGNSWPDALLQDCEAAARRGGCAAPDRGLRTMRQPNRGAPASTGRRRAARRPSWPRPAGRVVCPRRRFERPARRRAPPSARSRRGLRPLSERRYRMPDPQPASRRAVRSRGRESAGNGGGYLAQRGLGSPGARPALGGGAAQLGGLRSPKRPRIAASRRGGARAAHSAQSGTGACPGRSQGVKAT